MRDLLTARSGFVLAALFVTWATLVLLLLMVSSLHVRLRRLEQGASRPAAPDRPFGHLTGMPISELVGSSGIRVVLFVSSGCASCRRVLAEAADPSWHTPTAIAWTDASGERPDIGELTVLADGRGLSARLGIRVTPFALVADEAGRVVQAGPISSLQSLAMRGVGAP